jgi:hypothetical protein
VLVQADLPPEVYGSELVRAIVSVKWSSFARTFLLLQVIQYCTFFLIFLMYQVSAPPPPLPPDPPNLAGAPCAVVPGQRNAQCMLCACVRGMLSTLLCRPL